jgi:hypothetical protein
VLRSDSARAKQGFDRGENKLVSTSTDQVDLVTVGLNLIVSDFACLSLYRELDGLRDDQTFSLHRYGDELLETLHPISS